MPSTQRSHSAPSGNRLVDGEAEDVPSPGLLSAARWSTTRARQHQRHEDSPALSRQAGDAILQGSVSSTNPYSTVAISGVDEDLDIRARASDVEGTQAGDPWIRKTLLTLDGGGVRGFSSLLILRALMVEIANLEKRHSQVHSSVHPLQRRLRRPVRLPSSPQSTQYPIHGSESASSLFLPAHYFDYIAGTSTGGLIAIMLGRLHMTIDECLEAYENLADHVFGHPRRLHIRNPPWIPRDKYDHRRLEKIIKDIVKERSPTGYNSTEFRQPNKDMCRTIVIAWQKCVTGTRVPHLFRSYHHPKGTTSDIVERNPGGPDNYKIWEVSRATSAAPTYFKAARLEEEDEKSEYIDGGFGANNPTEEAYRSVKQLNYNNPQTVRVLVSVGTGKNLEADPNPSAGYALYMAYANAAAKWAAQSEATHHTMIDATRNSAEYFRLNVEHGLGKMKLDAWKGKRGCKTLELIRTKTQDYLDSPEGRQQISASAQELVNVRRARSADLDRWERFCHGVEYACCVATCLHGRDKKYEDRETLRRHVLDNHPAQCEMLDSLLDRCKQFPDETNP